MLSALQKEIIQATKDYNRELIRSLMKAGGTASDIYALTHDPLLELLRKWDHLPDEAQEALTQKSPQIAEIHSLIHTTFSHISPFMQMLRMPQVRFVNEILIPLAIDACAIYKLTQCFNPLGLATTAGTVLATDVIWPVIQKAAVEIGVADVYHNVMRYLSTYHGDKNSTERSKSTTPASKTPAPKNERVVPTQKDQLTFSREQKSAGLWENCKTGGWQGSFQSTDGKYRFTPTIEKWEYEVYKKTGGGWAHCGIMRPCGPDKGKILEQFTKKGLIK